MPACVMYFYKVLLLSRACSVHTSNYLIDKTNGFYFKAILFLILCVVLFLAFKNVHL